MDEPSTELGEVTWISSDDDSGPDCGIAIGLGNGEMILLGDMPNRTLAEHGIPDFGGWWLVHYTKTETRIVAKAIEEDAARDFLEHVLAPLLRRARGLEG